MRTEEADARDRLLFHLENQVGFWFALVIGDDPRPRSRLREVAEDFCHGHGIAFHRYEPPVDLLSGLALDLARGAPPGLHWIRADGPFALIEQWDAAATRLLMAMNERREAYRRRLDGGIIIEGRDPLKRLLREAAPDMFSIRSFIAEPGFQPEEPSLVIPDERDPTLSLRALLYDADTDPDFELQRALRLARSADGDGGWAWLGAMMAAGSGFFVADRTEEALRCAEVLLARAGRGFGFFEGSHDRVGRAAAMCGLAIRGWVALDLGEPKAALHLVDRALRLDPWEYRMGQWLVPLHVKIPMYPAYSLFITESNALFQLGDLIAAEKALLYSIARLRWYDNYFALWRDLAEVRRRQGKLRVAESEIRWILSGAPNWGDESTSLWSRLMERHRGAEMVRVEILRYYLTLGEVLRTRGDLAGAIEALQAGIAAARVLRRHDLDRRARLALRRARLLLADVLFSHGAPAEALAVLDQCLDNAVQEDDEIKITGYFRRAVKLGEQALRETPDPAALRDALGNAYLRLSRLLRIQGRGRAARRIRRRRRALRRSRRRGPRR